jgi:flavin reductase (DIM6/NTAB) family NADH-FMN oxidoreductase RutF
MPVKQGPVPPFPPGADPDEYDRMRRRLLWKMPSGLYVIGSTDRAPEGWRNLMTANWVTQVAFEPKLLAVAVDKTAFTHELIAGAGVYSVNLLDREDRALVRKFTKPVDVDHVAHAMNGIAYRDGEATGAPILEQAVAYLECEVREPVDCGDHTLFVGEVVMCAFLASEETDVLRMEDTRMNYGG